MVGRIGPGGPWLVAPEGTPEVTFGIGYDPYDSGTFWGKWLARNPYHSAYRCRVYQGFLGDVLASMRVRHYVIDRIEGPTDGQVTIVAKDLFSIIEEEKAMAPLASRGELSANITAVSGSATLNPAGIGALEYPASGHVVIGDEAIVFTRSGDVLTFTTRGALGTTAEAHDDDDLVQLVKTYTTQLAVDIVYDLLLNYTSLTSADLPKAEWDIALASLTNLYSSHITEPTPVAELIGELAEQAGFTIWPDVETGQIKVAALRAAVPIVTVNDNTWIVDGSYSQKRQDDRRVSQVWVYYGQKNPVKALDDVKNFHSRVVTPDLNAESDFEYGVPKITEIFSRWIPQFGRSSATQTGERVLTMFRDPPIEANFKLHASRDGDLALARYFNLETFEVQDDTGSILPVTMATVKIEHGENELEIRAQQVTFAAPDAGTGERVITVENNAWNLNLRTVHDSLYAAPVGTETVRFIVLDGVTVGSTSATTIAMQTGAWPAGVTLYLDNLGRIQGKGGTGGNGGTASPGAGVNGVIGGTALSAEYAVSVDNTGGEIWGGGGGGGGGGGADNFAGGGGTAGAAGGGGGGGAGTDGGNAGSAGTGSYNTSGMTAGATGTPNAGGASGSGGNGPGLDFQNGGGGVGGGPGLSGTAGSVYTGASAQDTRAAGIAGAAGKYILGNSFVTWVANGDRRGGVA
jgi:hypothetical protein